jgi:hypothetical protein
MLTNRGSGRHLDSEEVDRDAGGGKKYSREELNFLVYLRMIQRFQKFIETRSQTLHGTEAYLS